MIVQLEDRTKELEVVRLARDTWEVTYSNLVTEKETMGHAYRQQLQVARQELSTAQIEKEKAMIVQLEERTKELDVVRLARDIWEVTYSNLVTEKETMGHAYRHQLQVARQELSTTRQEWQMVHAADEKKLEKKEKELEAMRAERSHDLQRQGEVLMLKEAEMEKYITRFDAMSKLLQGEM